MRAGAHCRKSQATRKGTSGGRSGTSTGRVSSRGHSGQEFAKGSQRSVWRLPETNETRVNPVSLTNLPSR